MKLFFVIAEIVLAMAVCVGALVEVIDLKVFIFMCTSYLALTIRNTDRFRLD